jgi:alkyl hydroperoxide reductase subunit AhpC
VWDADRREIREPAPAFRARAVMPDGGVRELSLVELRARWVVLAFHPRDFSAICPTEVRELSKRAPEFDALGAAVIAASVDDLDTHRRWIAERLGPLAIPLAADPTAENARAWGALLEREGVAARATFVVDPEGVVRHASFNDLAVARSISETLRVLEALRARPPGPAERRPGEPTLGR